MVTPGLHCWVCNDCGHEHWVWAGVRAPVVCLGCKKPKTSFSRFNDLRNVKHSSVDLERKPHDE